MTSDERNRRMKYGPDVPRWWIPDFNITHQKGNEPKHKTTEQEPIRVSGADQLAKKARLQDSGQKRADYERYALKRRWREIKKEELRRDLNRDIRIAQMVFAFLLALAGFLISSTVGLVIGAAIGCLLMRFRIEL
jgi:Flp pilus assembly protein TadB